MIKSNLLIKETIWYSCEKNHLRSTKTEGLTIKVPNRYLLKR